MKNQGKPIKRIAKKNQEKTRDNQEKPRKKQR